MEAGVQPFEELYFSEWDEFAHLTNVQLKDTQIEVLCLPWPSQSGTPGFVRSGREWQLLDLWSLCLFPLQALLSVFVQLATAGGLVVAYAHWYSLLALSNADAAVQRWLSR